MNTMQMQMGVNKNDFKFQNQRHENDFGINMYSFKYREHDPTIGRFWQIDPLAESYVYNSTYAFSENKVVNAIELEGLEAKYINDEAWRQVKYEVQSLANSIDNFFSFGSKTEVETEIGPNTTTTTSSTTTVGSNFGETINFIMTGNTNKGNIAPLFNVKTETETQVGTQVELTTPLASGSVSTSVNQEGTTTVTAGGSVNTRRGIAVGGNASVSSDGKSEVEVSASAGTKNTTLKATATTTSNGKNVGFQMGMGIEYSQKNQKISTSVFVNFGQQ